MISYILSGLGMEKLVSKNVWKKCLFCWCFILGHEWWGNGGHINNPTFLFFSQMKVQGEFTVLLLPPLLSTIQARIGGGSADPQSPHKELGTIKKVDSFYTDLPLCSVWGLILAPRELSRCQGDRCGVLASSRAAAEPLSHTQAGTAQPGNRWEPLGSPRLWRMKNQKEPYWTQIQRESPAPFLSSLVPFLPFLRKHQWMWKAVFPLEAFECAGTPDAILCKWFPLFPAWGDALEPICISIFFWLCWEGRQSQSENPFQTTVSCLHSGWVGM